MATKTPITTDTLREYLHYDFETGVFTRRRSAGGSQVGSIAGFNNGRGYWSIGVAGRYYAAHRLAFLYMTGEWPVSDVDHINGDPMDNSWRNLRQVSEHENLQNQRRPHSCNRCGLLGVSKKPYGWQARIRIDGKSKHLGTFDTPEKAHAAYVAAKRLHHSTCTI